MVRKEDKRNKSMEGPTMPNLPNEIVFDILSRLPVRSLLRFRCVCKSWNALISDPHFVKTHLNRATTSDNNTYQQSQRILILSETVQSMDFETSSGDPSVVELDSLSKISKCSLFIAGSCNGLVCLECNQDIFLCNPATREYRKLPTPGHCPTILTFYGFGYDSSIDDYKMIRIIPNNMNYLGISSADVLTLKTNSWRRISDWPWRGFPDMGVFVNGALHWLANDANYVDYLIASFDLAGEKFKEVEKPNLGDEKSNFTIGVLGGCLCVFHYHHENGSKASTIWVLKQYGVKESWTKTITIPHFGVPKCLNYFVPLCITKNGELLMRVNGNKLYEAYLVMYNPIEKTLKIFRDLMITDGWFRAATYIESLVSPNGDKGIERTQA
ncbi:hypothetical protein L1049_024977 [Liquidambar formosana]|uniref:F-box domain-containing protein n=1 Tax=Liquidambar formosana TaxID=63359 RepID=A0AAP0X1M9_LIQFO